MNPFDAYEEHYRSPLVGYNFPEASFTNVGWEGNTKMAEGSDDPEGEESSEWFLPPWLSYHSDHSLEYG
ncbi:MAG TPA: hypothetical protein VGP94_06150 [Tepidisphaeraceae bacterium]|jgi:hypothetical protein|nr:hypothetical protein [Tepidisphaeraceae bacterium]